MKRRTSRKEKKRTCRAARRRPRPATTRRTGSHAGAFGRKSRAAAAVHQNMQATRKVLCARFGYHASGRMPFFCAAKGLVAREDNCALAAAYGGQKRRAGA